jgi:hypothetical protein
MNLFNRKQTQRKDPTSKQRINQAIDKQQRRLAAYLNAQTAKLSTRMRKFILLAFGILTSVICVGLIVQAYNGTSVKLKGFSKPVITQPALPMDPLFSEEDYRMLAAFQKMMDSLKRSPYGREIYDQILKERPGLLDSVDFLLKLR